jgi:hypothetical protein
MGILAKEREIERERGVASTPLYGESVIDTV